MNGTWLLLARTALKLTQQELGDFLDVNRHTIQRYEQAPSGQLPRQTEYAVRWFAHERGVKLPEVPA